MSDKINWQDDFILKDELLQGDFDAIEIALFDMPNAARIFRNAELSIVRGSWLKAAIAAGWIVKPECKALIDKKRNEAAYIYDGLDVDKMHPVKVAWLGDQVIKRHDAVMDTDPKNL
jgi:hypothetical protein